MGNATCAVDGCDKPVRCKTWCVIHYSRWLRHGDPTVTLMPRRGLPEAERFFLQVNAMGVCWEWTGSRATGVSGGYGLFSDASRTTRRTHTWAYEYLVGPVPDGLTLDHLCRNRCCCNPDHLEPVSMGVNTLRGYGPSAQNARKTHCKRGHPLVDGNLLLRQKNGRTGRTCRTCHRADGRRTAAKRRAAAAVET